MDSEDVQACSTNVMDYRDVSRKTELESSPESTMAKTFNLSSDSFESSADTPPRDGQLSASPDSDGIPSLSEREARGSPYINTDHYLNEHSSVGNSHTSTSAQQDVLTVVISNMNETFINAPVNRSPNSQDKRLSRAHHGQTGPETDESFSKHGEQDDQNEEIASNVAGGEGQLSSSDASCCRCSGNGHISLSSGEMVVRSHISCLEDQSLVIFSSMEDSSVSPNAGSMSMALECIIPDACKASTEQETKESLGHPSLGVTFIQANSLENLNEEIDTSAFSSHVLLPNEGGLLSTFIFETPTDQTNQVKPSSADAELLPQVTEESTSELGKTFGSAVSGVQNSDGDIQTSTPVQCIASEMPDFYMSPFNENVDSPSLQLEKRKQIVVASKEHPVAGITPSICKVKKTELQKVPKSNIDTVKFKDLTRMAQQAAAPGTDKLQKTLQVKKNGDVNKKNTFRFTTAKDMGKNTGASSTSKTFDPIGQLKRATTSGLTGKSSHRCDAVSSPDLHPAVQDYVPEVQYSEGSFEGMPATTSQVSKESAQHAGGLSSTSAAEMLSSRRSQVDLKPTPKKGVSIKTGVSSGSAAGRDRMWARRYAEGLPKDKKGTQGVTAGFPASRDHGGKNATEGGNPKCPSQLKQVEEANSPANNSGEVKKISLVAEASKSAGAQLNENKSRSQHPGSPSQGRGAPLPHPPAAGPRLTPLSARSKQGALGMTGSRITRTVGKPQRSTSIEGSHKAVGTEETSTGSKLHQNAPKPPQTPGRSSLMGPPLVPVRPPRRIPGLSQDSKNTPVSGGAAQKSAPFKSSLLKAKLVSAPLRNNGSATLTAAPTSKGSSISAATPLKKTHYGRLVERTYCGIDTRPICSLMVVPDILLLSPFHFNSTHTVDKNKAKTVSRQHQQQPSQRAKASTSRTAAQDEKRERTIHQLKGLLTDGNCRFQALAIVLQQTLAQHDDATTQCRKLSQEMVSLKGELACSVHSSECLEREKEALRAALQDATRRLQEEHQQELANLEQKLQAVHKAEWDHLHLNYLEETNKYKTLMQQQMEELKANQEAMKEQLESSHEEQLQSVRQQHESSLEELRRVHTLELQSLEQELKDSEAALSAQIEELTVENNVLLEKLAAEKSRRRELVENTQKDSHTLYLEQELESLKVVLEIKNKQLHKQEKKLLDVGKLTDKKVQLDEMLIKVQQENEDLKARMERHAALSRQLSTEQALLQESLQKESKVNKRLSMENEELLWKLHNGDVGSPRRLSPSPTSPPPPFKLQSPRASGFFSSPPVSPR
ncbi:microtubule-associated tumor suppressor 1 homolog A isoform X1 [Gambusia affinis]|uniref:microtubule-associated tumor suppressor 1 homolog A isoform X1 n=2 Tax=Gambusia affinis TaxID=33528 RepID=UPI001CDC55BF|nr:microtubule-associated tumor suppressor 1 homolog A isoform X1 [Gambusia affinis]